MSSAPSCKSTNLMTERRPVTCRGLCVAVLATFIMGLTGCSSPIEEQSSHPTTVDALYDTSANADFGALNPEHFDLQDHQRLTAYIRVTTSLRFDGKFDVTTFVDGHYAPSKSRVTRRASNVVDVELEVPHVMPQAGLISAYFIHPETSTLRATPVVPIPLRIGDRFNLSDCAGAGPDARYAVIDVDAKLPWRSTCSGSTHDSGGSPLDLGASRWLHFVPVGKPLAEYEASELSGQVYAHQSRSEPRPSGPLRASRRYQRAVSETDEVPL